MTDQDALLVTKADGVAEVTLNRPSKRNALNAELIVRLDQCWTDLVDDPLVRAVILTGAGDRAFCAGADLATLSPLLTGARQPEDEWDRMLVADRGLLERAMLRRTDFPIPIVGAFRGAVVAGGMELALACDLRVIADDSIMGLFEVRRGLIPGSGGTVRLPRQVSWAHAAEILLTGEQFSARAALEMGLVNRMVPSSEVLATARDLAARIALNAPLAVRMVKRTMVETSGENLDDALALEAANTKIIRKTDDAREGPLAFTEKRAPRFTGR